MDNTSLRIRAESFKSLHEQSDLFLMPCAWDAFSAILLERAGFKCIGTTSGGVNWVRGRKDYVYSTPASEMISAYADIANATVLPCSGDLENGYGADSETVAATITASIQAGMVGGSIEDQEVVPADEHLGNGKLFEYDRAIERIRAARSAADESELPYTLTARCEVFYTDSDSPYGEAVKRLNAYYEAGADCLFVPGLNDLDDLARLVRDVDGPISFGMGATPEPISLDMLRDIGIRRVSTGGGLTRAAFGYVQSALDALASEGSFDYLANALSEPEINCVLEEKK